MGAAVKKGIGLILRPQGGVTSRFRDAEARRVKQMLRGSIPTRGKRATNLTLLFVAKAGHEAYSKMSGGHLAARVGRDL